MYEEAGCGLEGFVTRKPVKDGKDHGQPLVETNTSRTKRQKRGMSTETDKVNKLRSQGQQKRQGQLRRVWASEINPHVKCN